MIGFDLKWCFVYPVEIVKQTGNLTLVDSLSTLEERLEMSWPRCGGLSLRSAAASWRREAEG